MTFTAKPQITAFPGTSEACFIIDDSFLKKVPFGINIEIHIYQLAIISLF